MGAYLSTPVCVKESEDGGGRKLKFGASSMQGWRISQEDAHCCLLNFDTEKDTSLFAVFDGHGGADVAQYTAKHLPDYVKSVETYKTGKLESALEEAFLGFDATLVEPEVVKVLKELANGGNDEENEEEDEEEAAMLCEEAEMPLESLLERYGGAVSVGGVPGNKALLALKMKKEKFQSPALRSKPELKTADDENGVDNGTRLRLDEILANGCEGKDNGDQSHTDSTKNDKPSDDKVAVAVDKNLSDKQVTKSLDKDSSLRDSDSIGKSDCFANGKVSNDTRTVSSKDETESHSSDCNELDVSHISDASDAVFNHSSETNLSSDTNNSSIEESMDQKGAIRLQLANIRQKKTEVEAEMEKLEEEVDQMEEKSEVLEKLMEEILSKPEEEGRERVEDMKKEDEALQKKISESNEKIVSLENRRVEMKRRISNLKRYRLQVIASEKASKCATAGKEEGDEDEEEDEMSDDADDEDDDDDDSEEEEEEEEEEDDCTAMMGGGDEPGQDSGCTAVVALLRGTELHVANAGDSRCVLSRAGLAVDMSVDHKPEDQVETDRIHKAGGRVTCDGRVNGGLNLSRAIGDHCYKQNKTLSAREQMITSLPDVKSLTVGQEDEFMVIACDGIWNVMTSQEVVDFVRERLMADKNCKLSKICEDMFDLCIAPDTSGDGTGCDNMTCVIVTFNDLSALGSTSSTVTPTCSEAKPKSSEATPTSSETTPTTTEVTSNTSEASPTSSEAAPTSSTDTSTVAIASEENSTTVSGTSSHKRKSEDDAGSRESKRVKEDASASNSCEDSC